MSAAPHLSESKTLVQVLSFTLDVTSTKCCQSLSAIRHAAIHGVPIRIPFQGNKSFQLLRCEDANIYAYGHGSIRCME